MQNTKYKLQNTAYKIGQLQNTIKYMRDKIRNIPNTCAKYIIYTQ